MPIAELEALRVYYEEQGRGGPILFLHQYFGTLDTWDAQRDVFSRSYRVILPDARGHGRTPFPGGRLRLTDLAADTAALIRHLDIAPVHVIGISLGAMTGLLLARLEPSLLRTLTVISPPHLTEPASLAYMDRLVNEIFPANEARWECDHREQGPGHVRSVLVHNFALDRREMPRDQIQAVEYAGEISCPTLVVSADNDQVCPGRRAVELAERIPDSELLVLPRAGHFPHRTVSDVFNQVLVDFLSRRA
jgi:3-oxoadipate enol-lactonase